MSAHRGLGIALSEAGQHAEAIAELKHALPLSENSPVVMGHLGAAHARQGAKATAMGMLKDLQAMSARQYVPASAPAIVYAALDERSTRARLAREGVRRARLRDRRRSKSRRGSEICAARIAFSGL